MLDLSSAIQITCRIFGVQYEQILASGQAVRSSTKKYNKSAGPALIKGTFAPD